MASLMHQLMSMRPAKTDEKSTQIAQNDANLVSSNDIHVHTPTTIGGKDEIITKSEKNDLSSFFSENQCENCFSLHFWESIYDEDASTGEVLSTDGSAYSLKCFECDQPPSISFIRKIYGLFPSLGAGRPGVLWECDRDGKLVMDSTYRESLGRASRHFDRRGRPWVAVELMSVGRLRGGLVCVPLELIVVG